MDDIEEFNINSEIFEGLYYIETNKYFPIRGNGWYYHPLVSHCLEKVLFQEVILKMLFILLQL